MPAVSVIMPVKNQEKYIEAALCSVIEQEFDDMEIIVINDGSTDKTSKKLNLFQKDTRIHIIGLPQSQGIVTGLNIGLNAATGEFIARMDGDDIMHPERILRQYNFMQSNPDVDLCGCCVTCFSDGNTISQGVLSFQKWHNSLLTGEEMRRNMYVDSPMVHPTFFGSRAFFQQLGGYRDTGFAEDYDLIFRAIFSGAKVTKLPELLLKWRDHPDREIRTNPNLKKDRLFRQKARFFREFDPLTNQPLYLFGIWRYGKSLLDAFREEGVRIAGVIDPSGRRLKSGVRGLPAFDLTMKLPENAVVINALPLSGSPIPEAAAFLAGKTVLNWVL
ncbi:MAG: glycosyltransferase [Acidobacteria bacterium]|nr:glycosyltransferase [Acidobacteriota bacterium]